jgi:transposase-like protein
MEKRTTRDQGPSRVTWDHLEEWVREKVQEMIQTILEEEVTELLGRGRSERREQIDSPPRYRNGYGKERNLTLRLCSGQALKLWYHHPTPAAGPGLGREI